MGVDTNLYLSAQIEPEAIAYALAKAMGEQPRKDTKNKDNIFSGRDYIKTCGFAPASMWNIEVPKHDDVPHCWPNLHRSSNAFGPCWLLIARARAEVIAVFRTVAEALGGVLVWNDCDDYGYYYHGPEDYGFMRVHDIACAVERAQITELDEERAAY